MLFDVHMKIINLPVVVKIIGDIITFFNTLCLPVALFDKIGVRSQSPWMKVMVSLSVDLIGQMELVLCNDVNFTSGDWTLVKGSWRNDIHSSRSHSDNRVR